MYVQCRALAIANSTQSAAVGPRIWATGRLRGSNTCARVLQGSSGSVEMGHRVIVDQKNGFLGPPDFGIV
ncbi:Major seminal plasma glycoprotein PSP-II [Dissostichus eleginoides]|uniref:Major seminal plasma glycoprotein PSP-II n=1 Tax=Dissostichus eleginoides TaxID=100907 RepID=A0AAD9BQR9_DISEL|nr:Major seminal plasma glycoprotein PSP-II [Dissostichus eleginoides]